MFQCPFKLCTSFSNSAFPPSVPDGEDTWEFNFNSWHYKIYWHFIECWLGLIKATAHAHRCWSTSTSIQVPPHVCWLNIIIATAHCGHVTVPIKTVNRKVAAKIDTGTALIGTKIETLMALGAWVDGHNSHVSYELNKRHLYAVALNKQLPFG